ncbi:UNVERIFIED_CONTAM: Enhancer of decapping protein 4 [Sesamum radiatum]|uniref:Enhancer of decapping protein 4 n=1 Tax=Sesamum radiatum TaxID=300843 RepID=A0AAW2T320_SESRA
MSYPTPPLQPQVQTPTSSHQNNFQNPPNPQNPNNPGARLMALLSAPPSTLEVPQQPAIPMPQIHPTSSSGSDFSVAQNVNILPSGSGLMISHQGPVIRMPSSKLPKGRHLIGDHLVYDIDVRLPGEFQPQLEVTPITKYGSDPGLVLGRQIAVNKTYICYGLKFGAIRVLNINTALRSLLKGLAQRVTDMAFFAEDVHLLASASVDGRVYVWKITEGPDEEDKPQITGRSVVAIQITGDGESVHPRVCWHCHKQWMERFVKDLPFSFPRASLVDLLWFRSFRKSLGSVTQIKIWEDRKALPIAVLRPHDSQPVNSVTFLAAPHRPDHIILITGGPLNREIKIWISASEEGWLLPSDAESWHCTQTLELKSSEARVEEAFFNQVVALPQAGLLLLANAKRNAIYAVHLEYGTSELLPHGEQIVQVYCVQTQAIQQYALDLSQCLPPPTENLVCEKSDSSVSRDAAIEGLATVEPSSSKVAEISVSSSAPKASIHESGLENAPTVRYPVSAAGESPTVQEFPSSSMESKPVNSSTVPDDTDMSFATSPPLPLSPRVSRTLSGRRNSNFEHGPSVNDRSAEQKIVEYSVDRQMDTIHANLSDVASLNDDSRNDNKLSQDDIPMALNHPIKFKHPTHLVTPSEILMASSSSEANHANEPLSESELSIQDVVISNDTRNIEVEVKVVGETRFSQNNDIGSREELHTGVSDNKEKSFCSQASDLGMEMARECGALLPELILWRKLGSLVGLLELMQIPDLLL